MGRAPCCDKANVKKGPWSPEEDAKLKTYIEQNGTGGNWIALPQKIGLKRCGKSCRLRWLNYLRPNIKHGGFTEDEENIICSLYISIGSRWSIIAAQLPGRTDNDIKNYWNTRLKKKLMAKQRKEQAACRSTGLLDQQDIIKRENNHDHMYLFNQSLINHQNLPFWAEQQHQQQQQLLMPLIHQNNNNNNNPDDQLTRLLMKIGGQIYDESHILPTNANSSYQFSSDQIYSNAAPEAPATQVSSGAGIDSSSVNYTAQWSDNNNIGGVAGYDVNEQGNFPAEIEAYFNNLQRFDGTESYSSVEVCNNNNNSTSSTSNSGGSSSNNWGEMNSLVNTPVSNFEAYQNGMLQAL